MKRPILLIILFITLISYSANFEVISFEKNVMDLTARRNDTKLTDVNGNDCAIVKVLTDLTEISFESTLLEKSKLARDGEYWVYLQRNTKRIKFNKEGVLPFTYEFPDKLEESTVYILKLTAEGLNEKLEDITINIIGEPENSIITLDGEEKGQITSIKTSVGKHELKVRNDGFELYTATIDVSSDKTMFRYKLDKIEDAVILIDSDPPGAMV